jgi:3',5'-cyclic AMP phosphodiesterase CpdA
VRSVIWSRRCASASIVRRCGRSFQQERVEVRVLVHLSDLHFGRLDEAVLPTLRAAVIAAAPDLVAISGDFTQRARRSEFEAARAFTDTLPTPRLVVPGNHDVPLWNLTARFLTPLRRYQQYIADDLEPEYVDEEMVIAGINTARSWAFGGGRINLEQVDRVVARLALAPESAVRVIVTHHPFDLPPGVQERRLLGRAYPAMAKLARANADLFLSGHLHLSHTSSSAVRYRIEGHSALIVQAGTLSTRTRGELPSFNVVRVHRPDIDVRLFVWNPDKGGFSESIVGHYRHTDGGWIPRERD